jgi:hypothetical protein
VSKHTPGPWNWERIQELDCFYLVSEDGVRIHSDGSACGEYSTDIDVDGPDAQLIAAAPELAEALQVMLTDANGTDYHTKRRAFEQGRAALKKAGLA